MDQTESKQEPASSPFHNQRTGETNNNPHCYAYYTYNIEALRNAVCVPHGADGEVTSL